MVIQFQEEKQNKQLIRLRRKEEEEAVQRMSQKTNIPYVDLNSMNIETDALATIKKEVSEKIEAACFKLVGKDLYVAVRSPDKPGLREELFRLQNDGFVVGVYLASRRSLEKAWDRYGDIAISSKSRSSFLDISPTALHEISERTKKNEDIAAMIEETENSEGLKRVTQLIEIMLGSSIATGSSDVHLEPQEAEVQIRFRQDGVLRDITKLDHGTYKKINSRIKILSRLKLTQDKQAQDGRFTIDYKDQEIEIRTSIVPGAYGESIVMRILNPDIISIEMKSLGIEPKLFEVLRREVHKPNGLILTTGPTGSGKTTTLYAFLKEIYSPEIKILTIEDPIEYHLQGITQTQVEKEKGYTFLSGLRGALRQDPDAIMVGEIRDKETAEIAVNASLTGHIVLSTLHTNNAAGAIPRMLDLGINPKVLPSALSVSIAQRLVRKLVPECAEAYTPDQATQDLIRKILKQADRHGKDLASYGVSSDQEIVLYRPKKEACAKGNGTGYKGRIGLFEAILLDEAIEKIITSNPSEREIRRLADKQGILSMQEDGVLKAMAGVTSLEEVQKVVDLTELLDDRATPQEETPAKITAKPKKEKVLETKQKPNTQSAIEARPSFDDLPGFVVPSSELKEKKVVTQQAILEEVDFDAQKKQRELERRLANIENSLGKLAGLMEKTTDHLTRQPAAKPLATLRETRKAERAHEASLAELREHLETAEQADDDTVASLADSVRDLEFLALLETIHKLEEEQREHPTKNITAQIRKARETLIEIMKVNPPQDPQRNLGAKSNILRQELRIILDHLFKIERDQIVNPETSAADQLQTVKSHIDEKLTIS